MTNREKYNFDYFTIEHYAGLVKLAKDMGFEFILHKDKFEKTSFGAMMSSSLLTLR